MKWTPWRIWRFWRRDPFARRDGWQAMQDAVTVVFEKVEEVRKTCRDNADHWAKEVERVLRERGDR